jgi:hypothetical protein
VQVAHPTVAHVNIVSLRTPNECDIALANPTSANYPADRSGRYRTATDPASRREEVVSHGAPSNALPAALQASARTNTLQPVASV